eukprot:9601875-Alexandrium_andersonii.AAC.1
MCIRDRCFVLAGGAAEADAVGRAAGRLTGNRFSVEEVVGDAHDRSRQQIMVRLPTPTVALAHCPQSPKK